MESQTKFVAISNQKGGVGKSAFTVLIAGYFHYLKGKNVLVVDCDYPQFSIHSLRERDKQTIAKMEFDVIFFDLPGTVNAKGKPLFTGHRKRIEHYGLS
jgi:cellulose biosynthesis protein BcsQ